MTGAGSVRERLCADAAVAAPLLLGAVITSRVAGCFVAVRLSEVEAYHGEADPASHAYRGPTRRNLTMYGAAGHLYVYRSHGIHWCANVVCGPEGTASALLLRGGRVVDGLDIARERRGPTVPEDRLARGPGNLGRTLGLDGGLDGTDLLDPGALLTLRLPTEPVPAEHRRVGPRVGVSRGADEALRFWVAQDPTVSAYRRSPRAEALGKSPRI